MHPRKGIVAIFTVSLFICLSCAGLALAAQDGFQSPYGQQQQLQVPSSPYPDNTGNSPYGGNQQGYQQAPQQQNYPPQQQNYPPQQQGNYPQGNTGGGSNQQPLNDVLGQFRLSLNQEVMPMSASYNFGIPNLGVQVSIMSLAQAQFLAAQQQQFMAMIPQMGGRITNQQQINVNGRRADLVVVTIQNQQANQSMVAYNFFLTAANVWVQVMGPAQAQAQVQQAAQMVLQGLQTR